MRLTIESLAYGGAAVSHAQDGRVVFIDGACPGDVVEVAPFEEHPRFARARLTAVLEASPNRVEPRCAHFGHCGGCTWQHVAYGEQLLWKQRAVADALERIGRVECPVGATVPSSSSYGYRNKVELQARTGPAGPIVGFTRNRSGEVVSIARCELLPASAADAPRAIRGAVRYLQQRTETSIVRIALRVSRTDERELDVWTPPGPFPRALGARVFADAVGATTVTRVIVKGDARRRLISRVEVLTGPGAWRETLDGDRYLVSAPSFFQVNSEACEVLRRFVATTVAARHARRIVDVYAGVGTFTLPLARVGEVVAIEGSASALADLERNVRKARLDRAVTVAPGDATHMMRTVGRADVVVVDPPRSGLGRDATDALTSIGPDAIVYISCDPATLARDTRLLTDAGYRVTLVQPFDLFPQTYHVETVAVLEKG